MTSVYGKHITLQLLSKRIGYNIIIKWRGNKRVFAVIALVILAMAVVVGIFTVFMTRKKGRGGKLEETNYRVFFIMGVAMTDIGIIGMIVALWRDYSYITPLPILIIGIVYLAIGLANRDKWKKTP